MKKCYQADGHVKKPIACNTCTIHLVGVCKERAWWFGPARWPMVVGMKLFAWLHRIRTDDYDIRSDECRDCLRLIKNELKERSPTFRCLNDIINPRFNGIRDSLLTPEEISEAQRMAEQYCDFKETEEGNEGHT